MSSNKRWLILANNPLSGGQIAHLAKQLVYQTTVYLSRLESSRTSACCVHQASTTTSQIGLVLFGPQLWETCLEHLSWDLYTLKCLPDLVQLTHQECLQADSGPGGALPCCCCFDHLSLGSSAHYSDGPLGKLAIDIGDGGAIPAVNLVHGWGTYTSVLSWHFDFGVLVTGRQTWSPFFSAFPSTPYSSLCLTRGLPYSQSSACVCSQDGDCFFLFNSVVCRSVEFLVGVGHLCNKTDLKPIKQYHNLYI